MCTSTYQLKLSAAVEGVLYTRVRPQSSDGGQVLQEDGRLQLPVGHHGRPGVERHQAVSMLLVVRVAPWDVQLLPRVHQHTYTCTGSDKVSVSEGPQWAMQQDRYRQKIKWRREKEHAN